VALQRKYLTSKIYSNDSKSVNVVDLITKQKFEEKKEKRYSTLFGIAALTILIFFGFIILL
tara:strand:- start:53 stop:235 length:183 start_codon:yes stop_codon:yes gene_type:complete